MKRKGYPTIQGNGLRYAISGAATDCLSRDIGPANSAAEAVISEVSAVMVPVGVRTGVGVTVAEMTTIAVTPGVVVIMTVSVTISKVGVMVGVGVKVGMGRWVGVGGKVAVGVEVCSGRTVVVCVPAGPVVDVGDPSTATWGTSLRCRTKLPIPRQ